MSVPISVGRMPPYDDGPSRVTRVGLLLARTHAPCRNTNTHTQRRVQNSAVRPRSYRREGLGKWMHVEPLASFMTNSQWSASSIRPSPQLLHGGVYRRRPGVAPRRRAASRAACRAPRLAYGVILTSLSSLSKVALMAAATTSRCFCSCSFSFMMRSNSALADGDWYSELLDCERRTFCTSASEVSFFSSLRVWCLWIAAWVAISYEVESLVDAIVLQAPVGRRELSLQPHNLRVRRDRHLAVRHKRHGDRLLLLLPLLLVRRLGLEADGRGLTDEF